MYLSPGHLVDPARGYCPEYELSEAEATRFLRNLQTLENSDLDAMLHSLLARGNTSDFEEIACRSNFINDCGDEELQIWKNIKKNCQYVLLWCWHAEQTALEIARLENVCKVAQTKLQSAFMEAPLSKQSITIQGIEDHFPKWKTVCQNAVIFLPESAYIVMNGSMLEDIRERCELMPLDRLGYEENDIPANMLGIKAPLWKITGHSSPASGNKYFEAARNMERLWIGRVQHD